MNAPSSGFGLLRATVVRNFLWFKVPRLRATALRAPSNIFPLILTQNKSSKTYFLNFAGNAATFWRTGVDVQTRL